jgi:hypothetical protein
LLANEIVKLYLIAVANAPSNFEILPVEIKDSFLRHAVGTNSNNDATKPDSREW